MEAYPDTLMDFEVRFGTNKACRSHLNRLRWPDKFICCRCRGREAWAMSRGVWLCRRCRRQTSVTAGTIFEDGRLPLTQRLMGTYQGAGSHAHLDYYLDEFTFRFNRRTSTTCGKLFYRLVQQAVQVTPQPYDTIVKAGETPRAQPIGGG